MAGRGNDGSGEGRDPGFDWIYGGKGGGSDPEPTRRIPVQPRPSGERGTPPPPPSPRRLPPPQQYGATPEPAGSGARPAWSAGPSRWRRPGTWVKVVLGLLALWLVFTIAVPIITWGRVDKVEFEPDGDRPSDQPGTTYLLVGNDSRAGLTAEQRRQYHAGNEKSELTDTIMLLHTGSGPTTLISVPRDSPLEIPGHGVAKVNSAYAKGGTPLLVATLERATGVRIDHYVEIGLGGLVGVVDAVGGIEICPKRRIRDKPSGLNVRKGCQEVDGVTALAYSRARKYSPISDLARVQQQREVVAAVGEKVMSPWSVLNPVRWWNLNAAVPDFFKFGEGAGPIDAGQWALAMTNVEKSCTVPLAGGDASWDDKRARQLFDKVIEDKTDDITARLCTSTGLAD